MNTTTQMIMNNTQNIIRNNQIANQQLMNAASDAAPVSDAAAYAAIGFFAFSVVAAVGVLYWIYKNA